MSSRTSWIWRSWRTQQRLICRRGKCEFTLVSFQVNPVVSGYKLAHHEHYVSQTYLPPMLDPVIRRYMKESGTGMQLSVWLKK